jgi:hypothetical protein
VNQAVDHAGAPVAATARLVPPRPNLGPEPLVDSSGAPGWLAAGLFAAVVIALGLAAWRRARRRRADRRRDRQALLRAIRLPEGRALMGRAEAIVSLAYAVRAALVADFGELWRAKTSEEVAADQALSGALSPETRSRLVVFLQLADRAKFSGADLDLSYRDIEDWALWVKDFVMDADARSTITGK